MTAALNWTPASAGPLPWDRLPREAVHRLPSVLYHFLAVIIARRWGDETTVTASDEELARDHGCSEGTAQRRLAELEERGWIRRYRSRGRRVIALLFTLKGRLSIPQPEVHPPITGAECIERPRSMYSAPARGPLPYRSRSSTETVPETPRTRARKGGEGTGKGPARRPRPEPEPPAASAPPEPRPMAAIGALPPAAEEPPPAATVQAARNEPNPFVGAWARLRARLEQQGVAATGDQTEPATTPAPAPEPPPISDPAAPARTGRRRDVADYPPEPAPEARTPAQNEFLNGLAPELRDRLDAWPARKRAMVLEWFQNDLDPVALREALRQLDLAGSAPAYPPPPDTPTPELIRALTGPPAVALAVAPTIPGRVMNELGDTGGSKSWATLDKLCREITAGVRDPESLAGPLERTLAALDQGQRIGNPGAYLIRGVQNWDREHGPSAARKETPPHGSSWQESPCGGGVNPQRPRCRNLTMKGYP
jgi:hypothetical protein